MRQREWPSCRCLLRNASAAGRPAVWRWRRARAASAASRRRGGSRRRPCPEIGRSQVLLLDHVGLEDVPLLELGEVLESDAALVSLGHLAHVVAEAPQLGHAALGDLLAVAQDAD